MNKFEMQIFSFLLACILIADVKSACLNNQQVYINTTTLQTTQACELCYQVLPVMQAYAFANRFDDIFQLFVYICTKHLSFPISVCIDYYSTYYKYALNVGFNTKLTPIELCDELLSCSLIHTPKLDWDISFPSNPKPNSVSFSNPKSNTPRLRILHLADIHLDISYTVGSVSNCLGSLCCRNDSLPTPGVPVIEAGYWGGGSLCDVPIWTVENVFDHISKNEQFDFIYYTGDLNPHDNWGESKSQKITSFAKLADLFKTYFPNKTVYTAMGNHEAFPANIFPTSPSQDNITWLYEAAAQYWIDSGLPADLANDIIRGAFYTVKLSNNTRLISLNMNYGYIANFWLYLDPKDPLNQFAWLANLLQECENNGEKVHIIGHQPPGRDLLEAFNKVYYEIVNRYENTITAQFFGHSHNDYTEVFYDLNDLSRPVNIAFVSPSITTFFNLNVAYRMYEVDGFYDNTSFQVLNHQTNYFDINEANINGQPTWKIEYNTTNTYGLNTLTPEEWNNLLNEMIVDLYGIKAETYIRNYFKNSDEAATCDTQCRINVICGSKQSTTHLTIPCIPV